MESVVDIVVISYNTKNLLLACLQQLALYTDEPHRVIVVDNASRDGTPETLQKTIEEYQWSHVQIIANLHNVGYAKACNQGIKAGTSPYILLLNSDVLVTPGWLTPLIDCMKEDSKIAVVGPKMIDEKGRITGAGIVGTYEKHVPRGYLEVDAPGKYEEEEDCFSVCGAAYLILRANLPVLGLFDEHYFFYFEETDYSLQARTKGFRIVYCPKSKIYHLQGKSSQDHGQLRRYFEESESYFRRKWMPVFEHNKGMNDL